MVLAGHAGRAPCVAGPSREKSRTGLARTAVARLTGAMSDDTADAAPTPIPDTDEERSGQVAMEFFLAEDSSNTILLISRDTL